MSSAANFYRCKISKLALAILSITASGSLYAQVDAGALQQGLEKQLPLPSPLALPEPERNISGPSSQTKQGEVRFTVNQFQLEGVELT